MAVFSATYILSALALRSGGLGDPSLVYANMMNLTARIMYCSSFIDSYFRSRGASKYLVWRHAVPGPAIFTVSILSKLILWYAERRLNIPETIADYRGLQVNVIAHLVLGIVLALTGVGTWWMSSGRFLSYKLHSRLQ